MLRLRLELLPDFFNGIGQKATLHSNTANSNAMSACPIRSSANCCTLNRLNNATRPHVWITTQFLSRRWKAAGALSPDRLDNAAL
jgi:hypothetical protein